MNIKELFDLSKSAAADLLAKCRYPEDALPQLVSFIEALGDRLDRDMYIEMSKGIWVAKNAIIAPSAEITAPCIIGEESEIRHCAFLRGAVLVGNGCVVGNSSEVKNSILFDRVQVPHFNYVGDSILGFCAHFGAGAVTSNVKSDKSEIYVIYEGERKNSGRRKLGAFVGDFAEIGCGAVLCPGTVIGKNSTVYPLSLVRGTVPSKSIFKNDTSITKKY